MPYPKRHRGRPPIPATRWYAVQIIPHLQRTAAEHLTRQNFTHFFPSYQPPRGPIEPLFQGYGFVQLDLNRTPNWKSINGTRGCVGLVPRHAVLPSPLPIGFVEALQQKNPLTPDDFDDIVAELTVGDQVVVIEQNHPLQGHTVTIKGTRSAVIDIALSGAYEGFQGTVLVKRTSVAPVTG